MYRHSLVLLFLVTFGLPGIAQQQDKLEQVAYGRYWLNLLHYKRTLFGGYKSQADGPSFFFSVNGVTDPLEELLATITAFKEPSYADDLRHPQCRFPERYRYLKSKLNLNIEDIFCADYLEWINSLDPQSATLVFASEYPENPGSTFGHTVLKIESKRKSRLQRGDLGGQRLDLLDYSVSYAADTEGSSGGIWFAFMGLLGGYAGKYNLGPYYLKVNEYNERESRDLWEYQLNLTPEQTRRMMAHYWELGANTYFDYYFSSENCAYHLLSLLEVANPDWNLTGAYNLYMAPPDSIKVVTQTAGAIRGIKYRPSLHNKMLAVAKDMSPEQKEMFKSVINSQKSVDDIVDPGVLDGVNRYLFFRKQKQKNYLSPADAKIYQQSLLARAKLGKGPGIIRKPYSIRSRPDLSHDPIQVSWQSGLANGQSFHQLGFRVALHDILNDDTGYPQFSQLEAVKPSFRLYEGNAKNKSHFRLEELTALRLTNLMPNHAVGFNMSWDVDAAWYSPKDHDCDRCSALKFEPAVGGALNIWSKRNIFYSLFGIRGEAGSGFAENYRWGPTLRAGAVAELFEFYRLNLEAKINWDMFQSQRATAFYTMLFNQSFILSRNVDVRVLMSAIEPAQQDRASYFEGAVNLNWHF